MDSGLGAGVAGVALVGLSVARSSDVGFGIDGVVGRASMGILVAAGASGAALCWGRVMIGSCRVGLTAGSVLDTSGFGSVASDLGVFSGAAAGDGGSGRSAFKASAIDV